MLECEDKNQHFKAHIPVRLQSPSARTSQM